MAYGCACVSFDCIAGPNEIITDKIDGYLVKNGDINALAEKMDFLINNPEERQRRVHQVIAAVHMEKHLDKKTCN